MGTPGGSGVLIRFFALSTPWFTAERQEVSNCPEGSPAESTAAVAIEAGLRC
jgi:hypothetical protein